MIVACPECQGPFEVQDGDIAELVQVQCPHCEFAMILDFAAANDPSLVEAGMQMASGFRSSADYRAAVAGPPARPHLEAVEVEPDDLEPDALEPDALEPDDAEPEPEPEPAPEPAVARPAASFDEAPTRVPASADRRPPTAPAAAPVGKAPTPDVDASDDEPTDAPTDDRPGRGDTIVGPLPTPPRGETVIGPPPKSPVGMAIAPDPMLEAEDAVTQIRTFDEVRPDDGRKAPHTPPATAKAAPPDAAGDDETPAPKRQPLATRTRPTSDFDEDVPTQGVKKRKRAKFESQLVVDDAPKGSMLGTAFVVLLALLALGLVGASMMQENTPDPRPLLEKLYRQYVK